MNSVYPQLVDAITLRVCYHISMGKRGPKPKTEEVKWSPMLAYAVGLIASDGCLSSNGRHLAFVSKDLEQIENIKKCLGLKVKIGIHRSGGRANSRTAHRVQWGDVSFYNFLLNIGITPRKSATIGALNVPDEYFFDFLRGSFDGDGSFYSYFDPRWKSSFMYYFSLTSASIAHINWLQKTLLRLLGVKGHISKTGGEGKTRNFIANLRYAKKESLKVMTAMYSTRCRVHLSRKRLKIDRTLRIVGESLSPRRRKLTK